MDINELEIRSTDSPVVSVDVEEERQRGEIPPQTIGVLRGMAVPYEEEIELFRGCWESVARGAAKKTLKYDRQVALIGHDMRGIALGRTDSKPATYRLRETDDGIESTLYVPDTERGKELLVAVERGDVRGQSIGFIVVKDEREVVKGGNRYRLTEIKLFEASYVNFPAYASTETPGLQIGRSRLLEMEQRGIELPKALRSEARSSTPVDEETDVKDDGGSNRAEREREIALAQARYDIARVSGTFSLI